MALPFINDTVGDLLNNYVKFITKQMQTVADAIFGADNENDNEPIDMPKTLQCRGLFKIQCKVADLSPLTDMGFYGWDYNYGLPPLMCGVDINFNNGELSIGGLSPIGRTTPSTWYSGGPGYDAMATLATEYIATHSGNYTFAKNTYPDDPIDLNYYVDWAGSHGVFSQNNQSSVFKTTLKDYADNEYSATTVSLLFTNDLTESSGYYVENNFQLDQNAAGNYIVQSGDSLMVTNTDNQQFINDYITNNSAEHNYTYNYTTSSGDDVTIYYGDNYVITKTDPDAKTTYNEYKNALDVVVNKINGDNNYNIKVPTYNDNKYGPPGEDDPSDDQESGGIYSGAQGMCNLYYMTAGEIKDLQNWFRGSTFPPGIQIPADFDPSDQLIGLMAFPIELGGSVDSTTITFRSADNQVVDTGVSCQKAYGDDLKFDMGTINIPARMKQRGVPFLDYSSQIEVYIPFCDVVQLDVQQVIGTTLKCEMWISPATGEVSAMLSSGTHPVAYTSGNCAQQLPISVGSYGAIAGAKIAAEHKTTQAIYQAAQNMISSVTGSGALATALGGHSAVNGQGLVEFSRIPQAQAAHGAGAAMGISAIGSGINTALALTTQQFDNKYAFRVAKASAPTHVSGSFGTCTSWHFPNYCYVKITRPHFQKPDNYGHTEAVPVVATKQLSELTGLTTCVNPDVSGIGTATMQELETIKSYLMSGVIL